MFDKGLGPEGLPRGRRAAIFPPSVSLTHATSASSFRM